MTTPATMAATTSRVKSPWTQLQSSPGGLVKWRNPMDVPCAKWSMKRRLRAVSFRIRDSRGPAGRRFGGRASPRARAAFAGGARPDDGHARAAGGALTHRQATAGGAHEGVADGEAETCPARRRARAVEAVEDLGALLGGDAGTGVLDAEADAGAARGEHHGVP